MSTLKITRNLCTHGADLGSSLDPPRPPHLLRGVLSPHQGLRCSRSSVSGCEIGPLRCPERPQCGSYRRGVLLRILPIEGAGRVLTHTGCATHWAGTHTHTHTYWMRHALGTHSRTHAHTHTHTHTHILDAPCAGHTFTHAHTHTQHTHILDAPCAEHAHTHTHTHTLDAPCAGHTFTHAHTHTHARTHTYTHTRCALRQFNTAGPSLVMRLPRIGDETQRTTQSV